MPSDRLLNAFGYDPDVVRHLAPELRKRFEPMALTCLAPIALCTMGALYGAWLITGTLHGALIAAAATALMVFNIVRALNAGTGYGFERGPEGISQWRPTLWVPVFLAGLCGALAQPLLAGLRIGEMNEAVEGYRAELASQHLNDSVSTLNDQLGGLRVRLARASAEVAPALGVQILQLERELGFEKSEGAKRFRARLGESGFLFVRLKLVWSHEGFAAFFTVLAAMLGALPYLLRFIFLATTREYERIRCIEGRRVVEHLWSEAVKSQKTILEAFDEEITLRAPRFGDPPFNTAPLLLGREKGVVVTRPLTWRGR